MTEQSTEPDPLILEIASLYEKELHIPETRPLKQYILCPVGLVGAGKSTVVKPLSEKLSLVRISGDEIRKILNENAQGYDKVYDIAQLVGKKFLDSGYSICVDSDCASSHTREFLEKSVEKYHLKLIWIHINPPEEFILNKLRAHKDGWMGNEELIRNYYERKPLHENLTMSFIYSFDTSRNDLPQQIDEAYEKIVHEIER